MEPPDDERFLRLAIDWSRRGMLAGKGGPFGAVVVCDGEVVGAGSNEVLSSLDPTAHAEVVAIRAACAALGRFDLRDCDLYASCEPCPMCLGAIFWSRIQRLCYANTRDDAAAIGFDDAAFYREIQLPPAERQLPSQQLLQAEALAVFAEFSALPQKKLY